MGYLQRARRTKRSFFPWLITLMLVACAWFKLVTLSSTLNKMNYQGTWCATNDNLDIKYTFNPQSAVSWHARIPHQCTPGNAYCMLHCYMANVTARPECWFGWTLNALQHPQMYTTPISPP